MHKKPVTIRGHLYRQRKRLERIVRQWIAISHEGATWASKDKKAALIHRESGPAIAQLERLLGWEKVAELGAPAALAAHYDSPPPPNTTTQEALSRVHRDRKTPGKRKHEHRSRQPEV